MLTAREVGAPPARPRTTRDHARTGRGRAVRQQRHGDRTGPSRSRGAAARLSGRQHPSGTRGRPTRRLVPHPDGPLVLVGVVSHESWTAERQPAGRDRDRDGGPQARRCRRRSRSCRSSGAAAGASPTGSPAGSGAPVWRFRASCGGPCWSTRRSSSWRSLDLSPVAPREGLRDRGPTTSSSSATTRRSPRLAKPSEGRRRRPSCTSTCTWTPAWEGRSPHRGVVLPGARDWAASSDTCPSASRTAPCPCGAIGLLDDRRRRAAACPGARRTAPGGCGQLCHPGRGARSPGRRHGARRHRSHRGESWSRDRRPCQRPRHRLHHAGRMGARGRRTHARRHQRRLRGGLMRFRRADPPPIVAGDLGNDAPHVGASEQVWPSSGRFCSGRSRLRRCPVVTDEPDRLRGRLERGQVRGVRDDRDRAIGEQPALRLRLLGGPALSGRSR